MSAHYASIPRTPDGRGVRNLLDAVAPGGMLLVVGHDLAPMRARIDTSLQSRPFDPDAYVRVDDVAAALADSPEWDIEVLEMRPRPAGPRRTTSTTSCCGPVAPADPSAAAREGQWSERAGISPSVISRITSAIPGRKSAYALVLRQNIAI